MSFTALDSTDFVVSSDSVTAPAWSSNQPVLAQFATASGPATNVLSPEAFYLNVYQTASTAVGAAVQFSIAYGHSQGLGSPYYNTLIPGATPTRTTYGQYKTLVYGTSVVGSEGFNFGGLNTNSEDIYVINVDRSRYKESLFPGTFNLSLSSSVGEIQLTDNSRDVTVLSFLDCGRVFDIVSGSNGSSATATAPLGSTTKGYTVSGSYGLFLPDIGTIILNPRALALPFASGGLALPINTTANLPGLTSSINNTLLYQAISRSADFQLNSQETISSNYVFVRVRNTDYNYTTNPTYISGSGDLVYSTLVNNPQTYITTVGLYNTNNELLAVGKMSRPLVKDFTKEALVRVKLDW
jgi:hypothetical protein